jgi:hypothetical protein
MKTEKKINYNNCYSSQQYLKILNKFYYHKKNKESLQSYRNSSTNVISANKNKNEIPYSIKPLYCSVPKDVSLQKIFVNMMNSSFKINENKSIYSKMSEEDLDLRNSILNTIKIFLNKNGIPRKIFCSIIFLYDILTIKNKKKKILKNYEEIGIGAAVLSLKFLCGKKKSFMSLKNFSKMFVNENPKNINEIEINSLILLNYYLSYASPITFMEMFFINGIIFINDKIKTEESGRIYELVFELMEKIMIISNEYIKYNPLCFCSCLVSFAREIYHLDKWPQVLTQAFGVNFYSFDSIYNEFHKIIIPDNPNENATITNFHKRNKTVINNEQIDSNNNNNEIKLQASSSVIQNIITTYRHKTPIKMEKEKPKKYISIYQNKKYIDSDNKNISDMVNSSAKNKIKNDYVNYYDKKDIEEKSFSKKQREDIKIEIPSLSNKKNYSLRHLYENKIKDNSNKAIKFNQRILTNNKEEENSNLATCENSNNYNRSNIMNKYKKNFIISYNNVNKKDLNREDNYNDNKEYESIYTPINSQKKYQKNGTRWGSIKKISKIKYPKECLFPSTETKPLYIKKIYK